MLESLREYLRSHRDAVYALMRRYLNVGRPLLLRSDLVDELERYEKEPGAATMAGSVLDTMLRRSQEAIVDAPWICFAIRDRIGKSAYVQFHIESFEVAEMTSAAFLAFKARVATGTPPDPWLLTIDLGPFNRDFPRMRESRSIGRGVEFMNRNLSSNLFQALNHGDQKLLEFLRVHHVRGKQLMLNQRLSTMAELRAAIRDAESFLSRQPEDATWEDVGRRMEELGFEVGWGRTATRMRDTLHLLSDVLEAPSPTNVEELLSRVPMIFSIAILSPHGYFGQSNVLGLPDTGGQVVYILDQVRALEKEMRHRLHEQGVEVDPQILVITRLIPDAQGTTCNQRIEDIIGTKNARILRVPFRDGGGEVVPHWISRFKIWPYLERFALDAETEILAELGGRPALIIGNYSDGCLVASLLAQRLGVTQCNIAHALEKTKYLHSALYWRDNEAQYHFACQFTADLIAMNSADFVITSTFQEIGGTEQAVGQYESYQQFIMPGLYSVVNGVDVFDPKFNIVSPGADPDVHFPYSESGRRLKGLHAELRALIYGKGNGSPVRGSLGDRKRPMVFTMARLDRIKNLTGLVEWYAKNERLRKLAGLLVVGGDLNADNSKDREEREQIIRMHTLFDEYHLDSEARWVGFQTERNLVGELYRFVADRRGVFVQPALFEAYGLTIIEAMTCGLPVFATCYGGPAEVIEHGKSGFHIDPNHGAAAAESLADYFETCKSDPKEWERVSKAAIERIRSRYTWDLYARRLMTLSRVYGFWKFVTNLERAETHRYLEMLYSLQYRPLAEAVPR